MNDKFLCKYKYSVYFSCLDDPEMRMCKKSNIFPFIDCPFKQSFTFRKY